MDIGKRKLDYGKRLSFWGFVLPAMLAILAFVEIPFILSVLYSFTKWNGLDKSSKFIGLANYAELITDDPSMLSAFGFTILFTLVSVVLLNAVALALAVVLDTDIKGRDFLRAAFYVPNIISLIIIGYMWRFIFSKAFDSFYELTKLPLFQWSWLGDPKMAFVSVVLVSIWQAIGFYMVVYIAGLQTVPREMHEAALIDGAGAWKRFTSVTLPLLMPSLTVCVFYSLSNGLKTFDVIFSLTFGGPGTATNSIALDIYKTAFSDSRFGYGAAKSTLLFILILIVTVIQLRAFKKREVES